MDTDPVWRYERPRRRCYIGFGRASVLVDDIAARLAPAIRAAPIEVAERKVDDAAEELARFVLTHVTAPRRDGTRPTPREAGERAAALVGPLLRKGPGST